MDGRTGKHLAKLALPESSYVSYPTFSPDGTQLVYALDNHNVVYTWDLSALRRHLAELGLDWDAPPLPPAPAPERTPPVVTVVQLEPLAR
jgi:hypothetical protein